MRNVTPMMISLVENLISQGKSAKEILCELDDIGLIIKPIDTPVGKTDWVVRFDRDGRIYTYKETLEEMSKIFTEHLDVRGNLPYSVWAWVDESWREVKASA